MNGTPPGPITLGSSISKYFSIDSCAGRNTEMVGKLVNLTRLLSSNNFAQSSVCTNQVLASKHMLHSDSAMFAAHSLYSC